MPIVVAAASVGNKCSDLGGYFSYSPAVPLNTGGRQGKEEEVILLPPPSGIFGKV